MATLSPSTKLLFGRQPRLMRDRGAVAQPCPGGLGRDIARLGVRMTSA